MTREEYIAKYGEEEGLRRWKNNEYQRRWRAAHPEKVKETVQKWARANPEKVKETTRRWREANPEKVKERKRRWKAEHPEKVKEQNRRYREENRDKHNEAIRRWQKAHPMQYRANSLLQSYRSADHRQNRGECTLTVKWIVDKIFTGHCIYCGETDWRLLGCDRKNNSKPHTPENVVCSCRDCNNKRHTKDFVTYALSIGATESEGIIINSLPIL